MAGRRERVAAIVHSDSKLRDLYEAAFGVLPDPPESNAPSPDTHALAPMGTVDQIFVLVGKALAAFESTLEAHRSPFDEYLECLRRRAGATEDCRQLSVSALKGLRIFVGKGGCVNCHHGPDLTDEEFHNVLVPGRGNHLDDDPGRMEGIVRAKTDPFGPGGQMSDCPQCGQAMMLQSVVETTEMFNAFKTPSLRQVALTSPYMHNGVYRSLREVVEHYSGLADAPLESHHAELLLRKFDLASEEVDDLIAFLCSLTSAEGYVVGKKLNIALDDLDRDCESALGIAHRQLKLKR